jgi:hypothetical protein
MIPWWLPLPHPCLVHRRDRNPGRPVVIFVRFHDDVCQFAGCGSDKCSRSRRRPLACRSVRNAWDASWHERLDELGGFTSSYSSHPVATNQCQSNGQARKVLVACASTLRPGPASFHSHRQRQGADPVRRAREFATARSRYRIHEAQLSLQVRRPGFFVFVENARWVAKEIAIRSSGTVRGKSGRYQATTNASSAYLHAGGGFNTTV